MPVPSTVAFTPFVDTYGMLSLKDISVSGWNDEGGPSSLTSTPIAPIRTPMFKSRLPAGGFIAKPDTPLESGADLTRPWVMFFERVLTLLKRALSAVRTRKLHAVVCWVDETETRDIWATIGPVDATTDPLVIAAPTLSTPRTAIPPYAEPWAVGDYVLWNDPSRGSPLAGTVNTSGRTVDWVNGDTFEPLVAGQPMTINGVVYTVVGVAPGGKQVTINASASIQAAVTYSAESFRRRYECAQLIAFDADTGAITLQRHWPGSNPGRATFETDMESHGTVRLYRVNTSLFTYEIKADSFLADKAGVPRRWDITLPHAAVVAVYMAAENDAGVGAWNGRNTSYLWTDSDVTQLPPAPGLRTHVGAAYVFEEPGNIVARARPDGAGGTISTLNFYPAAPMRVQDWASIRTMYGFVQQPAKNPATSEPLKVRVKLLYAADRIDGKQLYDPAQSWQNLEDLIWQKAGMLPDIASSDQGRTAGVTWSVSELNPPTRRRMPYCEQELFYWDPEGAAKAWPPPTLEGDAWLTFDVLAATPGEDSNPPADLVVVIQT